MSGERESMSRRQILAAAGAVAAASVLPRGGSALAQVDLDKPIVQNGRINQAVSRWCYGKLSLEQLCQASQKMGIKGIDLIGKGEFATIKKYGLVGTIINTHGIGKGFNRKENHEECIAAVRKGIEEAAEAGFPNVICFSGNRAGMDDAEGAKNCIEGLKKIVGFAEEKKVTIIMELLNSKRDHRDYMCDHTAWGAEVCKGVGSERMKLLYDIYHMQIQEGDVIATIRKFNQYIGHYHTGGVPGRNEIDETQELYYPAIMKAILATGYKGYVAHEFIPRRDPLTSLAAAVKLCDV